MPFFSCVMFVLFRFRFHLYAFIEAATLVQSFFDMHAPRQPHVVT